MDNTNILILVAFKVAEYTWFLFDYLYKKCINHKIQHV
jgi:hypothetical protein